MSQPGENRFVRAIAVILVASVAMVPMVFYGCSPEWARWDATQANAFFRKGETDDALYQLRDAVRKNPRDPVLKNTLAERLIEIDQGNDAIELVEQVLEAYPDNSKAMQIKSQAQKNLGEFSASLETELEIDKQLQAYRRDDESLNRLAYARALAGKDLHLAKRDIESAISKMNRELSWSGSAALTAEVRTLVLAAMVSRSCDAEESVIPLLSSQIKLYRKRITAASTSLTNQVYAETKSDFPIRNNTVTRRKRLQLRNDELQMASLLSCRAILYQDLEKRGLCADDRRETKNLGYNSEILLARVPDDKMSLQMISYANALLDTRGFICSLLPWSDQLDRLSDEQQFYISSYDNAIRDMDIAVLCSEIIRKSVDTPLEHTMETFDADKKRKDLEQMLATLLFHRQTLLERRGEDGLAERDKKRIRDLGFPENHKLH